MTTPYYKKASWIKKMSQAAKQERLAREKKEAEQKKVVKENYEEAEEHHDNSLKHPYQESVAIQEADEIESSDYKLSPTGRKVRAKHIIFKSQDDEDEDEEKMKNEGLYRPGWMLNADPKLKAKIDAIKKINKARRAAYGNPAAGKSIPKDVKEEFELDEKSLSDAEMKKREEIVKSMKKKVQGFKDRYGDRAKTVMYATATKMAMKEELDESNEHYDEAEKHLSLANDADAKGNKGAFHAHMADHHDSMSEWHDSKGRSASADKHAEKAEYHHEQSLQHPYKESFESMLKKVTKAPTAKERNAERIRQKRERQEDSRKRAADAFGTNPANKLSIRSEDFELKESDIQKGDRVVADLRKDKKYTGSHKYRSGIVSRVGEKGVHIKTDMGEEEWHPHKIVKKLGAKSVSESVELNEANHREFASQGIMHPDMAKWMQKGRETDFYHSKTGDKISGIVTRNTGKSVHIQANKDGRVGGGETHKFSVSKNLKEGIEMLEAKEPPFEGGVPAKGTVKDKSGAKHTPMSRVRDLARQAMKKQVKEDLTLEDLTLDDLLEFIVSEEYAQLDEISKATLGSYIKKAKGSAIGAAQVTGMGSSMTGQKAQDKAERKVQKRASGINKAVDRLTKEEYDLDEAMISYTDFHAKIAAHRKAGNDIADSHYGTKKAHYTVVDKEGTARKVTHTDAGSKMENLGKHKGEVEDESGQKVQKTVHEPAVKRGRGRPAGQSGLKYKPRDPASKAASAAKAAASKAANRAKKTK